LNIEADLDSKGDLSIHLYAPNDLFHEAVICADLKKGEYTSHSNIRLLPRHEGKGLGNAWLGAQVELFAAMGAPGMIHQATLMCGARKWAAVGMHVDFEQTSESNLANLRRDLRVKLEALREAGTISKAEYNKVKPYTALEAPDDLVKLVENDIKLSADFLSANNMNIDRTFVDSLEQGYRDSPLERDEMDSIKDGGVSVADRKMQQLMSLWRRVNPQSRPVTFSSFALTQNSYIASIDFSNTSQMKKIGERIGGWKFGEVIASPRQPVMP
jgi:hypothetical protein